jgi:hypothetical protein
MTKSKALALAKKRWKNAYVDENPRARDRAAKADAKKTYDELRQQIKELGGERDDTGSAPSSRDLNKATRLAIQAAEFAADVDGDEPSLSQLKIAISEYRKETARTESIKELRDRQKQFANTFSYRCTIGYASNVGGMSLGHVQGSGDTWEEACQKAGLLAVEVEAS